MLWKGVAKLVILSSELPRLTMGQPTLVVSRMHADKRKKETVIIDFKSYHKMHPSRAAYLHEQSLYKERATLSSADAAGSRSITSFA